MRSATKQTTNQANKNTPQNKGKPAAKQQLPAAQPKQESPKKEFQKSSSQLFLKEESKRNTPRDEQQIQNNIRQQTQESQEQLKSNQQQPVLSEPSEQKQSNPTVETQQRMATDDDRIQDQQQQENQEQQQRINTQEEDMKTLEVIDNKYGDQKIDISGIKDNINDFGQMDAADPSRPRNLCLDQVRSNEPLPSNSNRVNLGEFSVGNYREFQLREDLANLIEKYNKKFDGNAKKPNLTKEEIKETKYKDKVITNPIAVPDPANAEGNYSWMYLITPYYNQLVKEFNEHQMENNVLHQHFEYFIQMQEEKTLLNEEFDLLKQSEKQLVDKINGVSDENVILEDKMKSLEKNLVQVVPDRIREGNEKLENLSNVLSAKDGVIDQLLNEIALIKNEKDDMQNEMLFKKQRIDNLNIEFNTKELEYQRLWEEQQTLKSEMRGENNDSKVFKRENEALNREVAMLRDEICANQSIYEENGSKIQESKSLIQDYESRLRYANDLIMQLETEGQQIQLDMAQSKATIEGQNRAYNELRTNFYMMSNNPDAGKMSSPIMSIPKIVNPSSYYKPSSAIQKASINLMPSTSKALSQQVPTGNIKSYLSVKKTTIDLTSDINARRNTASSKDQRVRFSVEAPMGGVSNLPASNSRSMGLDAPQHQRRGDSMDLRIEKRNLKGILNTQEEQQLRSTVNSMQQANQRAAAGGSVNRNFIDTMSGLLGMSEDKQKVVNSRASNASNIFPLKRVEVEFQQVFSGHNSPLKQGSFKESPGKDGGYRTNMETDVSTDYFDRNMNDSMTMGRQGSTNSNMWTQTPLKNKVVSKGGPGNRSSQPQQINSVKQKQHPYSTRNQQPKGIEEEKYRQSTWEERMQQLPSNSAYKSSITFAEDGITVKKNPKAQQQQQQYEEDYAAGGSQPFSMARDYDVDIDALNEDDPQARLQIAKYKQQKIFELQDQRKLLQSQLNHIPEYSKQVSQRQKKIDLEADVQKLTKRISMLKYDLKKMNSKAIDD